MTDTLDRRSCETHGAQLPELATGRLLLRAPAAGDAPALAESLSDYAVASMLARVPAPYLLEDAIDWLATLDGGVASDGVAFAVTIDGATVGVVGLDRRGEALHIGYWLRRSHWRRGIMGEAVSAVLDWHFAENPDAVVASGVFTDNRASLALQNKLGFAVTGLGELFSVARNRTHSHIETMVDATRFTPVAPPPRIIATT